MIEFILCLVVCSSIVIYSIRLIHRAFYMNKYKTITELLDYFLKKAYDWIYEDQLFGYTTSGFTNASQAEKETIERNFLKMAFDLMGKKIEADLISFYGSRLTLVNNMVIYYRDRLAKDEIADFMTKKQRSENEK